MAKRSNEKFNRKCPNCDSLLSYAWKSDRDLANNLNSICRICRRDIQKEERLKNKVIYQRFCPLCNKLQIYKMKHGYDIAIKNNTFCRSCSKTGKPGHLWTEETRIKYSKSRTGQKITEEQRKRLSESHKNPSQEIREKMRLCKIGNKHSKETIEKRAKSLKLHWSKPENIAKLRLIRAKKRTKIFIFIKDLSFRRNLKRWSKYQKEKTPYCEFCYSEDNLHAHHIIPKAKFPQYAFDKWNCRVLCQSCHIICHKQGGY